MPELQPSVFNGSYMEELRSLGLPGNEKDWLQTLSLKNSFYFRNKDGSQVYTYTFISICIFLYAHLNYKTI